jgi:hypothetical protein
VTREISTRPFQKNTAQRSLLRRDSIARPSENERISNGLPRAKPKRDRRFESPPLQQRVTANRRSGFLSASDRASESEHAARSMGSKSSAFYCHAKGLTAGLAPPPGFFAVGCIPWLCSYAGAVVCAIKRRTLDGGGHQDRAGGPRHRFE